MLSDGFPSTFLSVFVEFALFRWHSHCTATRSIPNQRSIPSSPTTTTNTALIGGAVGGGLALVLLLVGVAIFFVCRARAQSLAPRQSTQHYSSVTLVVPPAEYQIGDMPIHINSEYRSI